jgi:hypothetical protein
MMPHTFDAVTRSQSQQKGHTFHADIQEVSLNKKAFRRSLTTNLQSVLRQRLGPSFWPKTAASLDRRLHNSSIGMISNNSTHDICRSTFHISTFFFPPFFPLFYSCRKNHEQKTDRVTSLDAPLRREPSETDQAIEDRVEP